MMYHWFYPRDQQSRENACKSLIKLCWKKDDVVNYWSKKAQRWVKARIMSIDGDKFCIFYRDVQPAIRFKGCIFKQQSPPYVFGETDRWDCTELRVTQQAYDAFVIHGPYSVGLDPQRYLEFPLSSY